MKARALATLAAALLAGAAAHAAPKAGASSVTGTVVQVIGADTLRVAPAAGAPVDVRLGGIEAPAACQPWGAEAHKALEELVLKQTVEVRAGGTVLLDGADVSRRLVEEGHAWSARVKWDRGPFVKQERMAQALGRGLHGAGGAVRPADYRRLNGPCP